MTVVEETFMTQDLRSQCGITEFSYSEVVIHVAEEEIYDAAIGWCRERFELSHLADGRTWNAYSAFSDNDGEVAFMFGNQVPDSELAEFKLRFG